MHIAVIVGSHRGKSGIRSNSAKVGTEVEKVVRLLDPKATTWTLDLGKNPLPFWDEGVWAGTPEWKKILDPMSAELRKADAFVVIAPEYSGMVPAALKNFFLFLSGPDVGHKPGLIIGVSSGRGGTYPIAELRMSSYKNTRINWIPEHIIVREADGILNEVEPSSESDRFYRDKILYNTKLLFAYANALRGVRESGVIDWKTHAHGM